MSKVFSASSYAFLNRDSSMITLSFDRGGEILIGKKHACRLIDRLCDASGYWPEQAESKNHERIARARKEFLECVQVARELKGYKGHEAKDRTVLMVRDAMVEFLVETGFEDVAEAFCDVRLVY